MPFNLHNALTIYESSAYPGELSVTFDFKTDHLTHQYIV